MSPTTSTQPGSSSGEEWLENIKCPSYFDFEAAVAYPCTVGDDNPPLRESVYDSDDETRGFFRSLQDNPSLHPTLHRRSLSPQRNRLQNMGKPLYRHRPKTTFAEYLTEFQQKKAHQTDGTMSNTTALPSKSDSSPARDLTSQTNLSNSYCTPSPPQQDVHRHNRSDGWTPKFSKDEKSAPSRRPRRSPASTVSTKVEQRVILEQPRPQAQPNPARRKPRPPERSVPRAASSTLAKNGRLSKPILARPTLGAEREFSSDTTGNRCTQNSGLTEKGGGSLKPTSASRSRSDHSLAGLQASVAEDNAIPDLDFVKIMEAHNQRLRIRKSERRSGSTNSSTESEKAFDSSQPSEHVPPTAPEEGAYRGNNHRAMNGDRRGPDLSENGVPRLMVDAGENSTEGRIHSTKSSSTRENSLSELLQMENEKVLEERKRRLPERRKALQENRRNALRNIRASGIGDRRINPISAQIEFTSAEVKRPLGRANDVTQSNSHQKNEQKHLSDAQYGRNQKRGLLGYRSRMHESKPILSSGALNDERHQARITNLCRAGRPKANTKNPPLRADMNAREADPSTLQDTEEDPTQIWPSKIEASDDLNLLLSEHNNRIRKNRAAVGAINN